ncbi:MAG TPA: hypothetical protein VHM90_08215 [Phycisphaerae bacterium]|jgi:hypothetical protein|nr:hypothetical protein [Phycisphaerae bacterium]
MKTLPIGVSLAIVLAAGLLPARAGLYDGNDKDITKGELADQDYWWAKFDDMMLDLAVKQKQPEGRIDLNLASTRRRLDELLKKYPKHEELIKFKTHADDIHSKIDQNASRSAYFNPGCPWEEANYAQLWVNWHYAKALIAKNDYQTAYSMLQNVMQNYEFMLKPDRMKDYPEDLRKWVVDNKAEADKMYAQCKEKLNIK